VLKERMEKLREQVDSDTAALAASNKPENQREAREKEHAETAMMTVEHRLESDIAALRVEVQHDAGEQKQVPLSDMFGAADRDPALPPAASTPPPPSTSARLQVGQYSLGPRELLCACMGLLLLLALACRQASAQVSTQGPTYSAVAVDKKTRSGVEDPGPVTM
jgi:hypothetical protein